MKGLTRLKPDPADSLDALVELIEDKYPDYKVIVDPEGIVGVELPDQTGGEYRYERGAKNFTLYSKKESCETDEDAKELYTNLTMSKQCAADARILADSKIPECSPVKSVRSDISDTPSRKSTPSKVARTVAMGDTMCYIPDDTQCNSDGGDSEDGVETVAADELDNSCTGSSRGRAALPCASSIANRSRAASARSSSKSSVAELELEDSQGLCLDGRSSDAGSRRGSSRNQSQSQSQSASAKRTAMERTVEDGKKALELILQDFGADQHIEHCRQAKTCAGSVSRLRSYGRKIGRSKNKEDENFSQTLFDVADEIEHRQSLFDDAKSQLVMVVMEVPSTSRLAVINVMPEATLCSLIGREGSSSISTAALSNSTEAQALFLLMSGPGAPRTAQGLGLHLVKGFNSMVKDTQRPVTLQHLEKLFKSEDTGTMAKRITLFVTVLANQSMEELVNKFQEVPDRVAENDSLLIDGWCPTLWADLCCTYAMGQVAQRLDDGGNVSQGLQSLCTVIVNGRSKLSARVRCYHKHIGGVSHAARDTWAAMEKLSQQEVQSSAFKISHDTVEQWVMDLREARGNAKTDPVALLVALGELICGQCGVRVVEFAKWLVWAETNLSSYKGEQVVRAGLCLQGEMMECAAAVLKNADYHTDVMSIVSPVTAEDMKTDGNGSNVVRDKAYFDDSDNVPDAPAMCLVTAELASILSQFPCNASESRLFKAVSDRAKMLGDVWKLSHCDITESHTVCKHLRDLGNLSQQYLLWKKPAWPAQTRENSPAYTLETFCDKATTSEMLPRLIKNFVESSMVNDTVKMPALVKELQALENHFPKSLHPMIKAATCCNEVEELSLRLRMSKTYPNIVQLNDALYESITSAGTLPIGVTRKQYADAKLMLGKELGAAFSLYEAKINRMVNSCVQMEVLGANIIEEIKAWDFKSCTYVHATKDKPHKESLAAAKGIEAALQSFQNLSTTASELKAKLTHQPATIRDKIDSIQTAFTNGSYWRSLVTARNQLANSMLVNTIMNSAEPNNTGTWPAVAKNVLELVKNNLRCEPAEAIEPGLFKKVQDQADEKQKPGKATARKSRVSVGSDASTAAPSEAASCSSAGTAAAAVGPRLKFRRQA